MKKALLIINPHAGRMKLLRDLPEVDMILYNGGYEPDVYFTKCRGDATEKVLRSASNYDLIVCGGGDGSVAVSQKAAAQGHRQQKDQHTLHGHPSSLRSSFSAFATRSAR